MPLVSIIIHSKNSEKFIAENINSIKNISCDNLEVLLVDNGSTDGTLKIASKELPSIKIFDSKIERSTQVNFGVSKSNGKYIYLTAADIIYDKYYIRKCLELCEKENLDAIYTSALEYQNTTLVEKAINFEKKFYVGIDMYETCRFIKKDVFINLGGYDENLVAGEDYDFQRRLIQNNYKLGRVDRIAEYHLGTQKNLSHVIKRSFYFGKTFSVFLNKYKSSAVKQLSPFRNVFFSNKNLLKDNYQLIPLLLIYKLIQYSFGFLGLLIGLLTKFSINKNES